jgi:hypothetical protein
MANAKRRSKRNIGKAALALGAAGVSFAMTGSASATAPPTHDSRDNARRVFLGEEEISDVSLATFHVFDKENESLLRHDGIRVAAGHGGCGGCGHGGGCGGCAHAGCGGCAHAGCVHAGGGGCAPHVSCAHVGGCGCAAHVRGCVGHGCRCARRGCRGCHGGCACSGAWIGVTCLGCAACSRSCWQWDPYLGRWINVCY